MYIGHRAHARREQRFDDSLRAQLHRSIEQLDARKTIARVTLVSVLLWGICPMAVLLLIYRINDKSVTDDGYMLVTLIFILVWSVASSVWWYRRQARERCRVSTSWQRCRWSSMTSNRAPAPILPLRHSLRVDG